MITYFKMKRHEWKVKAMLYGMLVSIIDNQKNVIDFIQTMYTALKDVPADELKSEFVSKIAEFAHAQAVKEHKSENEDN